MRNFTKTLVAVSLLTATSAYPLGIGGIKLHSALNQNLNAEIALVTSGETPEDISVKLASPAKFDEAGIPWSYFLSKIKFSTSVKPNGSVVIKLSSNEALKEPFLNFLLEVSWPKGSLYREFTVLVDPPATYKQAVVPVISQNVEEKPKVQYRQNVETSVPKFAPSDKFADNEPVTDYGPVRKRDTLWGIASRVKTQDVSVAQMAMAIYEANPDAFAKPNVNHLIAGKNLKIPDSQTILKLSQVEALRQFKQHKRDWREQQALEQQARKALQVKKSVQAIADSQQKSPESASESSVDEKANTQLTLEPPVEDVVNGKAVVSANGGKEVNQKALNNGDDVSSNALKNQLELENKGLQERFERIEQQLSMMQKMLELKDEQLASLQNQQTFKPEALSDELKEPVVNAPPVAAPVTPVVSPQEGQKEPVVADSNNPTSEPIQPAPTVVAPAKAPENAVPPAKPTPVKPSQPEATPADISDPYSDYYLLLGGLAVSILSGLGLLWWRKRKTEERLDTDMFAASSQITLPDEDITEDKELSVALVDDSSAYNVGMVGESAFLSEFTPSEFDAFETHQTELDPISEADVYLAYGRYQQAEDLMRQAIQDYPGRDDCKLKLLEIFQANENKAAFDNFIKDLINKGKHNDKVFWNKVIEMAEELSPGSGVLIGQAGNTPITTDAMAIIAETPPVLPAEVKAVGNPLQFDLTTFSVDDDLGFSDVDSSTDHTNTTESFPVPKAELSETSISVDEPSFHSIDLSKKGDEYSSGSTGAPDDMLDFNLDLFAGDTTTTAKDVSVNNFNEDFNSIDFDLDAFSPKSTPAQKETPDSSFSDDNSLDFDLSSFSTDKPQAPFSESAQDNHDVAFDLNAFSNHDEAQVEQKFNVESDQLNMLEFDLTGFDKTEVSPVNENSKQQNRSDSNDEDLLKLSENTIDYEMSATISDLETSLQNDLKKFNFEGENDNLTEQTFDLSIDDEKLLENYDFSLPDFQIEQEPSPEPSTEIDSELATDDFDFDFGLPKIDLIEQKHTGSKHFKVDDLADSDDTLETQLNLANAYIDMGDIDTARSIAEELFKGSAEQKKAAQEILNKIN